jgi:hypothetical protein
VFKVKEWFAAIGLLIGIALCPDSIASPLAKNTTIYPLETVQLETVHCPLLKNNNKNPDQQAAGNLLPHIPEPMVFDLIRPLGARKGELEMNALFLNPTRRRTSLEWALEIEYAFLNNHAIELELPFENMRLEELKLSYQATFGDKMEHRF